MGNVEHQTTKTWRKKI